jgi:hypothetical protein
MVGDLMTEHEAVQKESSDVLTDVKADLDSTQELKASLNLLVGHTGEPDDDLHEGRAEPSLSAEEEKRLRDAEAALRDCGTKFIAFAQTEKLALWPLRWLRQDRQQLRWAFQLDWSVRFSPKLLSDAGR